MAENIEASSEATGDNPIPRIRLGQMSFNGVPTLGGEILENCNHELEFPNSIHTFDKMAEDQDIQPALDVVDASICRVPWYVEIPEGYEDSLKEEKLFLEQCLFKDMEHPFEEFIQQVVSMRRYGFAPIEKVFRRRTFSSGSKFNDGKIGLRCLPLIDQRTVLGWKWDEQTGRSLTHLVQYNTKPVGINQTTPPRVEDSSELNYKEIPRYKFLLFRNKRKGESPQGQSVLVGAWKAWRLKQSLEEFLAVGVVKDLQGLPILEIPAEVMDDNADEGKKAEFQFWQKVIRNIHQNAQAGLILPSDVDESNNKLYKLGTVETGGQKAYDVLSIIEFYRKAILTALSAQQLVLGQDGTGSYSLSENISGVTSLTVEMSLREIEQVLNHDLIPQLFALNGNRKDVLPKVRFGDLSSPDLETLSKFIQRTAAVGLMPKTAKTVNWITKQANMPIAFAGDETTEEIAPMLTGYTSGAGEGLAKGSGNGTSDSNATKDNSTSNMEN